MKPEPVHARRIGVGIALTAALLSSACAAGQRAQTADSRPSLDGTQASVGDLRLRGLVIESPITSTFYEKGSSALVRLVVVNTGSSNDTLTGITSSAFTGWGAYAKAAEAARVQDAGSAAGPASSSNPSSGSPSASSAASSPATSPSPPPPQSVRSIAVPAGSRVSWGVPEAKGGLLLLKFTQRVYPGSSIRVTFTFANAGSKTISVPVELTNGPNDSVIPGPSATGQIG